MPTPTIFELYSETEYALALLRNVNPVPLDTYDMAEHGTRFSTEEDFVEYLKSYDAGSWAAFKVLAPVVIVKPGWGVVATVQPLPPLVRVAVVRIVQHPEYPDQARQESAYFTSLYDGTMNVLPTNTPELVNQVNSRVDELWQKVDAAKTDGEEDRVSRLRQRIKLLSWLAAELDKAFSSGAAYLVVTK